MARADLLTERTVKSRAAKAGWTDWILDDNDMRAARRGHVMDVAAGERVCRFFSRFLRHTQSSFAGRPFDLLPHQREFTMRLFGWKRADGRRRYTKAFQFQGRRGGKSYFGGGLGIYGLIGDHEPSAQVAVVASSIDQARAIFTSASQLVEANEELAESIELVSSTKRMVHRATMSHLMVLTRDHRRARGVGPSMILWDEVVAFEADRRLWNVLQFAQTARQQPLFIAFSTAGADYETSLVGELHEYATAVQEGRIEDDAFLPQLFQALPTDDPGDPATWAKANPSLGSVVTEDALRAEYNAAKGSAHRLAAFKTERLNIFVGALDAFLNLTDWDKCSSRAPNESPREARQRILDQAAAEKWPCFLGLDMGGGSDLSSLVALFPREDERVVMVQWSWLPRENLKPHERPPIKVLADEGWVTMTDGNYVDKTAILDHVVGLRDTLNIVELAFDQYFIAGLLNDIVAAGIECTAVPQNCANLHDGCVELERLVLAGKWDHLDDPMLRWQCGHLKVLTDRGGRMKPHKPRHAAKIDCFSAGVSALVRVLATERPPVFQSAKDWFGTLDDLLAD